MRLKERVAGLWHAWFLAERPSVSLGLFRIAVAFTVGCHIIPSLLQLQDNYLSTGFKEKNLSFFTPGAIALVEKSPDRVVILFAGLFFLAWFCFLIGFKTQKSALLTYLCCLYFYALNALHIGTLSFDILLVTFFLVCATGYPGDFLSLDSILKEDASSYRRLRPFFIQRLLQLQMAWTFWYTALSKMTAGGNWIVGNPYHALMHYPPFGVVKMFPGRAFLAQHPDLCYAIGLAVIAGEILLPVLWFIRKTRFIGLVLGFLFHLALWITLHVPTIFLFLFPVQMLLFIDPESISDWIDKKRLRNRQRNRDRVLYDGNCGFCARSIRQLKAADLFDRLEPIDFHAVPDLKAIHPELTRQRCEARAQLVERNGRLSDGFLAFRRMSRYLPFFLPLLPLLWLPGAGWAGQKVYDSIAARRSWLP